MGPVIFFLSQYQNVVATTERLVALVTVFVATTKFDLLSGLVLFNFL